MPAVALTAGMATKHGKIRLLIVHDSSGYGGMEVVVLRIAREVDRSRFELMLGVPDSTDVYRASPTKLIDNMKALDVPVERLPCYSDAGIDQVREIVALAAAFRRLRPDVIHIHTSLVAGAKKVAIAAALARVPGVIRTEHNSPTAFDDGHFGGKLRVLADRVTDQVFTVSNHDRDEQIREVGRCPELVTSLTNGVDCTHYSPDSVPTGPWTWSAKRPQFVIGTVGRLEVQKRPEDLVTAHYLLRQRGHDVDLLLVGDGTHAEMLRQQVEDLGTADHAHFVGSVDDPRAFIAQFDVGVMTSHHEGFALAPLEMMAMGVPTVVTDIPGLTEAVVPGETSLIADVYDAEGIADAIEELLVNSAQREAFGEAARNHVIEHHSLKRYIGALEEIYADLAAG